MEIDFADSRLALIETDRAAETNLPAFVIQCARLRLQVLRAAPDLPTLQNWKSLGLRTLTAIEHRVGLSAQWEMALRIEEKSNGMTVTVHAMVLPDRGMS